MAKVSHTLRREAFYIDPIGMKGSFLNTRLRLSKFDILNNQEKTSSPFRAEVRPVMPRVLVPTDDDDRGLVEGYRSLGWDIAIGTKNFEIRASQYDVVHHQWPEEYSGWQVPTERQVVEIGQNLRCSQSLSASRHRSPRMSRTVFLFLSPLSYNLSF